MKHEYIDIPNQPEPLQQMLWDRQAIVQRIGEAAAVLCAATEAHNALIISLIALDMQIRATEG